MQSDAAFQLGTIISHHTPTGLPPSSFSPRWSAVTSITVFYAWAHLCMYTVYYSRWQYALSWLANCNKNNPKHSSARLHLLTVDWSSVCLCTAVEHMDAEFTVLLCPFFVLFRHQQWPHRLISDFNSPLHTACWRQLYSASVFCM